MIQEEIATLKRKKIRMKKEMEELQRRLLKLRDDNRDVFDASAQCDFILMEMLSVWNIYNAYNFDNIKVTLFYCRVDLLRNYEDVHV